jgi:tetratricopeptide (TPR) repeat protein
MGLAIAVLALALRSLDAHPTGSEAAASEAARASGSPDLSTLAAAFRDAPSDPARAHAFRLAARHAGQLDSAIGLFEATLARDPKAQAARLELGLAFVDKLATSDLDVQERFILGGRAISLFSEVLNADPADWAARYARGMTHVLFPRQSRHSDPAVKDLDRLIAQQKTMAWRPYHVLTHIGLGDAYVVNKQKSLARETWEEGRKLYGDHPELTARLALEAAAMDSAVSAFRSLERPFDTDLSFLWAAP